MAEFMRKSAIPQAKAKLSLKLDEMIRKSDYGGLDAELNRICRTLPITDFMLAEEFIEFIKQNQYEKFGNTAVRAYGRAYFTDFKQEIPREKEITTSCGKKVNVKVIICNPEYDAQVPDAYEDVLVESINQQLPIFLNREELRGIACGVDTYNALIQAIQDKIVGETNRMLWDIVTCELNKTENYKKIETITYCCDRCEGQNYLSALSKFALQLQRNTVPYNIQGRDYNLPISQMMLIKSYDFDARMTGMLATTFNYDMINIQNRFNKTFAVDINISDTIIADIRWPALVEVLNEIIWNYSAYRRGDCGVGNYVARFKLINFLVAVPVNFVKISCDDKAEADALVASIATLNNSNVSADTQPEAETEIKKLIDAKKQPDSKLQLEYTFSDFVAPTADNDGSIVTTVAIKDATGNEINNTQVNFVLKKK